MATIGPWIAFSINLDQNITVITGGGTGYSGQFGSQWYHGSQTTKLPQTTAQTIDNLSGLWWAHGPWTSTQISVLTRPKDVIFGGNEDLDISMALDGITGYLN